MNEQILDLLVSIDKRLKKIESRLPGGSDGLAEYREKKALVEAQGGSMADVLDSYRPTKSRRRNKG